MGQIPASDKLLTQSQEEGILQCTLATPTLQRKAACVHGSPTFPLNVTHQSAGAWELLTVLAMSRQ